VTVYHCQYHGQYHPSTTQTYTGCPACAQQNQLQNFGAYGASVPQSKPTEHEEIIKRLDRIVELLQTLRNTAVNK
jgi:hypothetical protein